MTVEAPSIVAEEPAGEEKPKGFEFDARFQSKIAALALRDTVFAQRTDGLIKPEYFHSEIEGAIVAVTRDYYQTYKKAPDKGSYTALFTDAVKNKRFRKDLIPELKVKLREILTTPISDRDFVIDKCAEFAKQRAMEEAILASVGALGKGDYAKIEQLVKGALSVGATDDGSEYDYFGEIENRTAERVARAAGTLKPEGITTGYPEIDKHLYHEGFGRKELSALMARAKWGKSMGLGDFGKNASMAGYNVLICSCEVSAKIYAERLDANFSETAMRLLKLHPFDVQKKIKKAAEKAGVLKIHDYATGTLKPSQLRRLIERYRARGIIFDEIIVDYADIMCPEHFVDDMRENSRTIWIDLRAIGFEQNAAMLTATQTNRDGAKAFTAKATDVAEDYNKVRTVDLMISGNATEAEIAAGEARLCFAASRNQAEVTIRIQQDRECMRFLKKVLGVEK
jgi:replicative DNA helicase